MSSAVTVVATAHIAEKSDRLLNNFIARDFKAEQAKHKWLTDITEFQFLTGKIRLSLVVDFFDGKVVSSSLSARPEAELVNTIVDKAVET
ncbi:putative transposase protein [Escherichia coli]|nr:putative transposase protein [Escherichia coli]